MASERRARIAAALSLIAVAARADERLWVAGLFADPSLAAPVIQLAGEKADRRRWRLGVAALELSAEWERLRPVRQSFFAGVSATPSHAAFGNRIYVDGERAQELEFEARSAELRAGWRAARGERWSWEVAGLATSVSIDGADSELRRRWRDPYFGVAGSIVHRRIRAERPLTGRIEGLELSASVRFLTGEESFWRGIVSARSGQQAGRVSFGESLVLVGGGGLDRVNAFLAGGSWDAGGPGTLYGFRFAEFRLEKGAGLFCLLADFSNSETWSIGLRASLLAGDEKRALGAGVAFERTWRGIVASGGVFLGEQRDAESCCDPVVAFSLGSALFGSWFPPS